MAKSKGGGSANTGQGQFNNYQQYWQPPTNTPSYGNNSKGGGFSGGYGGGFGGGIPDFGGGNIGGGNYGGNFGGGGKRTGFKNKMVQPRMPSLQQQYSGLNQGVQAFQPLGIRGYEPPQQFYGGPVYGGGGGGGFGGGFGGGYGGGFNPFAYNSFQGNPYEMQPQIPSIPTPQPPVTNYPGGSPYDFEQDFGYEDFGNQNFERDYGRKDFEPAPPQLPAYTTQVVEGGADIRVPTAPIPTPESVRPDFNQDLNIPDFSNYTLPTLPTTPVAEPVLPTPAVATPVTLPPISQAIVGRTPGQFSVDPREGATSFNPLTALGAPPPVAAQVEAPVVTPESVRPDFNQQTLSVDDFAPPQFEQLQQLQQRVAPQVTTPAVAPPIAPPIAAPQIEQIEQLQQLQQRAAPQIEQVQQDAPNFVPITGNDLGLGAPPPIAPPIAAPIAAPIAPPQIEQRIQAPQLEQIEQLQQRIQPQQIEQRVQAPQLEQIEQAPAAVPQIEQLQQRLQAPQIESDPLTVDQNLQQKAIDTQQALELAQSEGPATQGQFQAAKNAAYAANAQKTFAESGGKTFAQEQAEQSRADQIAKSIAERPASLAASPVSSAPPPNYLNFDPYALRFPKLRAGMMSTGGLIKGYAEGGQIEGNESSDRLEEETVMALMGKHPNPKEVFTRYLEAYGEDGLMALAAEVEQMMESQGRMIEGQGNGTSDEVPAMIDGMQPAALSKDEYVIPADVVAHSGNGSSEAGGRKFDELVATVRRDKTGNTEQPEGIEFEQIRDEQIRQ